MPSSLVKKILLRGTPLLFNELLWAAGITMQTQALSTRGLSAIAGLNISNTLNNVVNTFFLTMGIAISIVIGQLIGAGKLKEAKETDTKMITFSLMISLGVSALLQHLCSHVYITQPEKYVILPQDLFWYMFLPHHLTPLPMRRTLLLEVVAKRL